MGLLRVFLALVVVNAHSNIFGYLKTLSGSEAVLLFFVISGFYMALILSNKYQKTGLFYSNRFLRLYPTYAIVLIASMLWFLIVWGYTHQRPPPFWIADANAEMSTWQWLALQFGNFTMVGLDLPSLFHWQSKHGFLFLHGNAGPTANGAEWVGRMPWVTQAWSIGAEIWFYFLAPLLVRRSTTVLLAIGGASFAQMLWMTPLSGLTGFFFPANLWCFVSGILLYRWYRSSYFRAPDWFANMAVCYVIVTGCLIGEVSNTMIHKSMLVLIALSTPYLFKSFANRTWDATIGNLSYPIYLSHVLIINVLEASLRIDSGPVVAIGTIAAAAMLVHFVERPIDRFRQMRLKNPGSMQQIAG